MTADHVLVVGGTRGLGRMVAERFGAPCRQSIQLDTDISVKLAHRTPVDKMSEPFRVKAVLGEVPLQYSAFRFVMGDSHQGAFRY